MAAHEKTNQITSDESDLQLLCSTCMHMLHYCKAQIVMLIQASTHFNLYNACSAYEVLESISQGGSNRKVILLIYFRKTVRLEKYSHSMNLPKGAEKLGLWTPDCYSGMVQMWPPVSGTNANANVL